MQVILAGFPRKAFPQKIGKGRHWTPVFFAVAEATPQDSPKASPRANADTGLINPLPPPPTPEGPEGPEDFQ